ncbi:MAG: hypothetical protein ABJA34_11395 [Pseudonocardiales bacterium]
MWTSAQQVGGKLSAGADNLLAVVENQQLAARGQRSGDRVQKRRARLLVNVKRGGNRRHDQFAVRDQRQVHKGCDRVCLGGLQDQSGLADSAWTSERQQSAGRDQRLDLHELLLAADEAGQLLAQCRGWTYCAGGRLAAASEQRHSARIVQAQGFNETLNGLRIWETTHTAFEVRDATCAQSGLLGQRLLRQAAGEPVAPQ